VFTLLRFFLPRAYQALLSSLLWIQLQTILYAHDFHEYHGRINFTWPWTMQPMGGRQPRWARDMQLQSQYLITNIVMAACYWFGYLVLGMRGEYAEYTPTLEGGGDVGEGDGVRWDEALLKVANERNGQGTGTLIAEVPR